MSPAAPRRTSSLQRSAVHYLRIVERLIFFVIGVLLFAAAFALLLRALVVLWALFLSPGPETMQAGSAFLDVVLLVLMVVELAYTVILSLRGVVLSAEPFLIVGLIAVIRRILVITVGEFKNGSGNEASFSTESSIELGILTAVVLVFVVSIAILRSRRRSEPIEHIEEV